MEPVLRTIRARLLERWGPNGVRLAYKRLLEVKDADSARRALAGLGVRVADEEFAYLERQLRGDQFAGAVVGVVSSRRSLVLGEAWKRLKNACGSDADVITTGAMHALFDPSRFQVVQTGHKTGEQCVDELREIFSDESNPDGLVSFGEFTAYYAGVGLEIADDSDFERHVMRAWNLDKPYIATRDELAATATHVPASKAGRAHPLYQPSSAAVGKNLDQAFETSRDHFRAGAFTKHAPRPSPSSGLNTAVSRSRII